MNWSPHSHVDPQPYIEAGYYTEHHKFIAGAIHVGYRNEVDLLFECLAASEVTLHVRDENDQPTTAMFVIRDKAGLVYPSQAKRLAPDFAFHPQVYRADGETEKLPPGEYTVEYTRGPEYITKTAPLKVDGRKQSWSFKLERWIDPSKLGWWSGDHHIHAAGCAHYTKPTEGVHAPDMIRHCLGEDLKVGCNLTWGPCFDYQKQFFTGKVDANMYSVGMFLPVGELAPGASKTVDAELFAGPQEENQLSTLAPGLELVKDYGIFKILAEPLFWLLTQLHKLIGNWGWSIVALVVLLKIAFFWLNAKAYGSMAKMKAINPRIMEMRERLKDKPQQMQQEMMRIYREEKVNPLGGCLPIFVQMPFFIALYWVLLSSVEMRHAPWVGWITDLSAKDPYFILPLLMTGTSLLQTWLNPTPPDPVQAKMMWIMPLAFSVMFFVFPAGLVLYWLTNNILSIAQQYLINKRLGVLGK